MLDIEN